MNQFIELLKSGGNTNEKKRVVYVDVKKSGFTELVLKITRIQDHSISRISSH